MALEISYSPLFFENLEAILKFFDERNGSDNFSKKLLKMIHNHEVPSSILGPATLKINELQRCSSFFFCLW